MITLRDYQQSLVDSVRGAYRKHRSVCMVAPTGAGKSVVFGYITENAVAKGKRVLILAHRRKLIHQTSKYFSVPYSYIMRGEEFNPDSPVHLATVQTLSRRLDKLNISPDLIVVDEGHLAVSEAYKTIYDRFPMARILVVTATPERGDGRGLGEICDAMVVGVPMKWLVQNGYLVPVRVFAPTLIDVSDVPTVKGEFDAEAVSALIDKPTIHGDILAHYRLLAQGRTTLAFANTVKESKRLAQLFRDNGYRAESLDAGDDDEWKDAVLARLQAGELDVVFNCQLYIEGLDIPEIDCVMDTSATQSVTRYLQKIGRGMRPADGKKDMLYIDFTANYLRHGMPAQQREWTLNGRVKKPRDHPDNIPVRQCPACFAAFEPQDHCPECGVIIPKKERKIKTKHGWLTEVQIEEIEIKKKRDNIELWKAKTLEDFLKIAEARGYQRGWAYMRWKLKQISSKK